jgi:hypothetical protein
MRPLKIKTTANISTARREIQARLDQMDYGTNRIDGLLNGICAGNIHQIDELMQSAGRIVLTQMLHLPDSKYSVDERLAYVQDNLKEFVIKNDKLYVQRMMQEFFEFYIKQSLLAMEINGSGEGKSNL